MYIILTVINRSPKYGYGLRTHHDPVRIYGSGNGTGTDIFQIFCTGTDGTDNFNWNYGYGTEYEPSIFQNSV